MQFSKGAASNKLKFPLDANQVNNLKQSTLHSPSVGNPHNLKLPNSLSNLSNLNSSAKDVAEIVSMVNRGVFPLKFMEKHYPKSWGKFPSKIPQPLANEGLSYYKPIDLAKAVQMDNPIDMPNAVLSWVLEEGYKPKAARKECVDFLAYIPNIVSELGVAIDDNLKRAFEAKYNYGVARPEEILGYNLTVYMGGCPNHPSFPAGHGAAAAAVKVILDKFDLDQRAIDVIRATAYCWAMFRTFAGVHYPEDNLAGLKIGGLL